MGFASWVVVLSTRKDVLSHAPLPRCPIVQRATPLRTPRGRGSCKSVDGVVAGKCQGIRRLVSRNAALPLHLTPTTTANRVRAFLAVEEDAAVASADLDNAPDQPDDAGQAPSAPRVIGGRYRLGTMLGHGVMGTVWAAYDELLRRDVAVKEVLLPPGMPEGAAMESRERAMREARAIRFLRHQSQHRGFRRQPAYTAGRGTRRRPGDHG